MATITVKVGTMPGQPRSTVLVAGSTAADALEAQGINAGQGVLTVNGSPATPTQSLNDGDRVIVALNTKGNSEDTAAMFAGLAQEAEKDAALRLYKAARDKAVVLQRELDEMTARLDKVKATQDEVIKAFENGTLAVDEAALVKKINAA